MKNYKIKVAWNGYILKFVPNQGSVFTESYTPRTYVFTKFGELTAFIERDINGNIPGPEDFEKQIPTGEK